MCCSDSQGHGQGAPIRRAARAGTGVSRGATCRGNGTWAAGDSQYRKPVGRPRGPVRVYSSRSGSSCPNSKANRSRSHTRPWSRRCSASMCSSLRSITHSSTRGCGGCARSTRTCARRSRPSASPTSGIFLTSSSRGLTRSSSASSTSSRSCTTSSRRRSHSSSCGPSTTTRAKWPRDRTLLERDDVREHVRRWCGRLGEGERGARESDLRGPRRAGQTLLRAA